MRLLARQGLRVRAAVRRPELADFLKPMGDVGQVVPVQANVRHAGSVGAALAGSQAAINATGITVQRGRQRFDAVHVEGTRNIAEASKLAGIRRVIQVSGIGADEPGDSPSAYVQSKIAAEAALRAIMPEATILRPSIMFGPGDGFFTSLAAIARISPVVPVIGGQKTRFQPVYVGDTAEAALACLRDTAMAGSAFELGGPSIYTMRQIAQLVLHVTGRQPMLLDVPFALAKLLGLFAQYLPAPPLTYDQACLLEVDNIVRPDRPGFESLGIVPTAAEVVLPTYLDRFREGGRYSVNAA